MSIDCMVAHVTPSLNVIYEWPHNIIEIDVVISCNFVSLKHKHKVQNNP